MQHFTNAHRFRKWMAGPFLNVHLPITLLPKPSHQESDLDFLGTGAVSSSDPLPLGGTGSTEASCGFNGSQLCTVLAAKGSTATSSWIVRLIFRIYGQHEAALDYSQVLIE